MNRISRLAMILALFLGTAACAAGGAEDTPAIPGNRWWKGNLHAHSLWSDGDEFPEMIVDWYKRQGYDFVAISDHNMLAEGDRWIDVPAGSPRERAFRAYLDRFGSDWVVEDTVGDTVRVRLRTLDEYRTLFDEPGRFLVLQSEEISDRFEDKPLHVNATNVAAAIEPQGGSSVREVLQNNIDAVLEQRRETGQPMFPHVNHPNFVWAVTIEDLIGLEGEKFFEIYNGHPLVNNGGDAVHPSTERLWDVVLTQRLARGDPPMFGLATDDSHDYHSFGVDHRNPGRGWVMVRAPELTPEAIIAAMERGDFYASTGVELRDVRREGDRIVVEIDPEENVAYTTTFIGTRVGYDTHSEPVYDTLGGVVSRRYSEQIGVVLTEIAGTTAAYRLRGDEMYVRAKVVSTKIKRNGYREGEFEVAWTQPFVTVQPGS